MLPEEIEDHEVLAEWLTEKEEPGFIFRVPQKGMKEKLVELAQKNAELVLSQDREKIKREEGRNHRRGERDRASSGDGGTFPRGGI